LAILSKTLLEWNKVKFKGELTQKEMISLGLQAPVRSRKRKNQVRREKLCLTCQAHWKLEHICCSNGEENLLQPSGDETKNSEKELTENLDQ